MQSLDDHAHPEVRSPLHAILDQRGQLIGYANALVRNIHTAEDLFQEALVLATQERFNDDDYARAWICVTIRNLAMNEVRSRA
ncbi:MAG: sigma factor [Planctomycetota bacterium]